MRSFTCEGVTHPENTEGRKGQCTNLTYNTDFVCDFCRDSGRIGGREFKILDYAKMTTVGESQVIYEKDHPLFFKAVQIEVKKGEDYNAGTVKFEDYFPFGDKSYVQILFMKALRLVSLVEKDGESNFEGIDDTLMDMIVYANKYAKDRRDGIVK